MEFVVQPNRHITTSGRSAKILQSSPSLLQWSKRRDLAHLHHLICPKSIAGNSCNSFLRRRGRLQDVTLMSQAPKRHSVKTGLAYQSRQFWRQCWPQWHMSWIRPNSPTLSTLCSALFVWVAQWILRRKIRAPCHRSSQCRSLICSRDKRQKEKMRQLAKLDLSNQVIRALSNPQPFD